MTGVSALSTICCSRRSIAEKRCDHTLDVVRIGLDARLHAVLAQGRAGHRPDRDDSCPRRESSYLTRRLQEETHCRRRGEGHIIGLAHGLQCLRQAALQRSRTGRARPLAHRVHAMHREARRVPRAPARRARASRVSRRVPPRATRRRSARAPHPRSRRARPARGPFPVRSPRSVPRPARARHRVGGSRRRGARTGPARRSRWSRR